MSVNNAVMAMAGTLIVLSSVLVWLVSPYWLILTGFVGLNMFQSAFSGVCPAAAFFRKIGLKTGCESG